MSLIYTVSCLISSGFHSNRSEETNVNLLDSGLHHQGIFRVSGSQVEISNFREGFERGEDPLADTTDASDINSVAGVLKLYLRELREPLFPIIYFDHFVTLARESFS